MTLYDDEWREDLRRQIRQAVLEAIWPPGSLPTVDEVLEELNEVAREELQP